MKRYSKRSSGPKYKAFKRRLLGVPGFGLGYQTLRSTALARSAISSRIHSFKRVCQPFGIQAGNAGSVTPTLINVSGTNPQLGISTVSASTFVQGTGNFGGALQFMLAHVANPAELTNLFDQYRIKAVKIDCMLTYNSAESGITTAAGAAQAYRSGVLPTMHYTVDFDDNTAPTNIVSVLENSYATSRRMDKPFSIMIKPRAQQIVTNGSSQVAGGLLASNTWLDNAATAVPHYGLKFWVEDWPISEVAGTFAIKFIPTYYLEAKNVI